MTLVAWSFMRAISGGLAGPIPRFAHLRLRADAWESRSLLVHLSSKDLGHEDASNQAEATAFVVTLLAGSSDQSPFVAGSNHPGQSHPVEGGLPGVCARAHPLQNPEMTGWGEKP
jgi:hypothetical protein